MKKFVACLATSLALIGAPAAYAQTADAASTAAAKELFESMNYRTVMIGAMQQMAQGMGASLRAGAEASIKNNPKLSDADKQKALAKMEAELPAAINAMQSVMNDQTLVDDILAETVPLYARHFSADELKQITAFYRSPVGAKMLNLMPQLMGEGMQVGQQIVQRRIGPMLQKLQQGQK
ncbi:MULTISPECIES: DUF2059 domain-containing protein [unclassified Duganella]|jgi:hypothetical protein|uniref:DUF2059 domain-containing protein n=1 Tax=unclassified Duganella TaxID=2636909 RepID=UPI00087F8CF9|nr:MULTISPECIES: DUF2059 domain-containing protein [unclassified Duganella]SDH32886.1 hypothetical protein SAMN05216320_11254 [Duganella sp. OV458]SDK49607.1 hypothetical protein SAMN05428973_11254 [Duganella sp. OV510]